MHRLNVIRVRIPPLRERPEDIPNLAARFLQQAATELEVDGKTLLPETQDYLSTLPWSGNVRQLENTCRWLTVMASGNEVHLKDLPADLTAQAADVSAGGLVRQDWQSALDAWARQRLEQGDSAILEQAVPIFETTLINAALDQAAGRRQDAARLLGWGRNTLTRKIKELGMKED